MSFELRISSQAEADVAGAFDWYQARGINLGVDFIQCVDATLERIRQDPQIIRLRYDVMRLALTPRFPYGIYFIWDESAGCISIRRVLHLSQNAPAYLKP